jgi:hypothetical protein
VSGLSCPPRRRPPVDERLRQIIYVVILAGILASLVLGIKHG